jgi:hypothetical protein
MINTSISTDKRLNSLSAYAELVYLKTIPHLDRDGLILGDPMLLWGRVCPRRTELMGEMSVIIDEWIASGLVIAYDSEDGAVLFFTGFAKNQSGMRYDRESASSLPCPPGYVRGESGLIPHDENAYDGVSPELVRSSSGITPSEVKYNNKLTTTTTGDGGGSFSSSYTPDAVQTLWRENMPSLTPAIKRQLETLVSAHGPAPVLNAIDIAIKADKRTLRYVEGVLRRQGAPPAHVNGAGKTLVPVEGESW